MEALIFAAGLGTRLRPLTDTIPKALVEVEGVPMLERVARRLVAAGVRRLVVNVHAFADEIERFVRSRGGFGVETVLSFEEDGPLETGGGLLRARGLLAARGPILVHNVDVLTDLPLGALCRAHVGASSLATLAVMERPSKRHLLFDDLGLLGRDDEGRGLDLRARPPVGAVARLAFAGVHVIDPGLLDRITETGAFSILVPYLRLAAEGERLAPFRVDGSAWIDVGRPEQLEEGRRQVRAGRLA